jgi:DNA-binding IclR family transcriptional regulator
LSDVTRRAVSSPIYPVDNMKKIRPVLGTQLVDRTMAILRYLGDRGQRGATASEIAASLELSKSTAHRLAVAMARHRLIEREQATKRYRLGLSLFALGAQAADSTAFRKICHPALLRIAAETGDTVLLMGRSGFNAICIDREVGTYTISSLTGREVGGQIPMGVGPSSQLLLALMPPEDARVIIEANAGHYSRFNKLTVEEIWERLPMIIKQGYAVEQGRLIDGLSAVAMPIAPFGRDVVGCLTIHMTTARLTPMRLPQLLKLLRHEINQIEEQINPAHP